MWDKVFAMAYDLGARKRYAEFRKNAVLLAPTDYPLRKEKGPGQVILAEPSLLESSSEVSRAVTNLPGEVKPDAKRRGSSLP